MYYSYFGENAFRMKFFKKELIIIIISLQFRLREEVPNLWL